MEDRPKKPPQRTMKDAEIRREVTAAYLSGEEIESIAARIQFHPETVRNYLRRWDVPIRDKRTVSKNSDNQSPELPIAQIVAEYKRGDAVLIIAKRHGVPQGMIHRHLAKAGIPHRGKSWSFLPAGIRNDVGGLARALNIPLADARDFLLEHGVWSEDDCINGADRSFSRGGRKLPGSDPKPSKREKEK